jgi:uncharacterized protein (DUF2141 family)
MKELFLASLFLALGQGADIEVLVKGVKSAEGSVGCALFKSAKGFPMDASVAQGVRQKAKPGTLVCKFEGLPAGTYAVSVSHDANDNGKTDTKLFGIPTEDWAVSNNVRPKLRAPRFEEASFALAEGKSLKLELELGR